MNKTINQHQYTGISRDAPQRVIYCRCTLALEYYSDLITSILECSPHSPLQPEYSK